MVSKKEYDCFNLGWFVSSLPCSSNLLALEGLANLALLVIFTILSREEALANLITNGIVAVTIKVAAMGLDPSKHLGKEITFVHNCICSYMGVVYVAKEGNMKH
ncbi:unnamed protein product [Prunus armeniaca]|uniref:Uncharacterized protein n=1 Tax=Prunus armeniaca TaxID=36596 RepID=A0A6J5WH82_PRUAR|nr:unnamed protein product [Prunus armeniaca]